MFEGSIAVELEGSLKIQSALKVLKHAFALKGAGIQEELRALPQGLDQSSLTSISRVVMDSIDRFSRAGILGFEGIGIKYCL